MQLFEWINLLIDLPCLSKCMAGTALHNMEQSVCMHERHQPCLFLALEQLGYLCPLLCQLSI